MGLTQYKQGRYTDAVAILQSALADGVVDADLHYLMAECLLKLDSTATPKALEQLNHAIELNSNSVSARTLRGRLLLEAGQTKEAVVDLELANWWIPHPAVPHTTSHAPIVQKEERKKLDLYLTGFGPKAATFSRNWATNGSISFGWRAAMRPLGVLLVVTGLSYANTDTPHIRAAASAYQQAKAALLRKDTSAAVELLVKAIQIEPTFLDAYNQLIEARIAAGDRLEAATVITRFLEIKPEASHYRLLLAQILLVQQQWNRALAQFSIVLKDDPFNADAPFGFVTTAKRLGMQDRASEALSRGRDRYPLDKRFR